MREICCESPEKPGAIDLAGKFPKKGNVRVSTLNVSVS